MVDLQSHFKDVIVVDYFNNDVTDANSSSEDSFLSAAKDSNLTPKVLLPIDYS